MVEHRTTDFEKNSAKPFLHRPRNSTTVRSPLSLPDAQNNTQVDDSDSCAETEEDLDDDQEMSVLARTQPSAFQMVINREVRSKFFFHHLNSCQLLAAILARGQ